MEIKLILQIIGVVLGLTYLYLEYKANIWLWVIGMIMPVVHGVLYYVSGLYADAAMNAYYVLAGLYGLVVWKWGNATTKEKKEVKIAPTPLKMVPILVGAYAVLHVAIYFLLVTFTDSTVPIMDSFTTALSIVAMYMLAQKYTHQWLVWLVVDLVTAGLYCYKGIPLTAGLYLLYSVLAVIGYRKWCKQIKS